MWFMQQWRGHLLSADTRSADALAQYSRVFNAIEGNTTLYGLPAQERAEAWRQMAAEGFRFSFKIPRSISQAGDIAATLKSSPDFHRFMAQMEPVTGLLMLQLPGHFGPRQLPQLAAGLEALRSITRVPVAVEVRHPGFFDKSRHEPALLRLLADHHADRVVFDSRGLFADISTDPAVQEAQRKKPRFAVHPVATADNPVIRFIGHSDWQQNRRYLQQWAGKLRQWIMEGKQPWLFIHTASNQDAPQFARWCLAELGITLPPWPGESAPAAGQAQKDEKTPDLFG